ncbi:MAG TPA: YfcC family protein [Thermoanaerobaculia bacterium]|nr:YfcC family protein [Thermoanaerobaculia bacterium]
MKKIAFPDALVLIFLMIVVAQLATYLLPSGEYERELSPTSAATAETVTLPPGETLMLEDGRSLPIEGPASIVLPAGTTRQTAGRLVKDGTYHRVDAEPLPWHASLTKLPVGLARAADIIFFVLIVGGVIAVIRATGAIDALIGAAINRLGGSPMLLTGGMVTLFAVGSSTIGMAEEYMPFIPILVAMCLALRMDAIVALAIVYVGAGIGYGAAALNPFTVMIAKDIAGQPPSVWFWQRWILLVVLVVIGVHHILRYARRIQADPSKSLVLDVDYTQGFTMPENVTLTGKRIAILAAFAAMIGLFVWGVDRYEWYLTELAALFMGMALFAAIVGGLGPNLVGRKFLEGAAELSGTAILIGFARTIEVVLSDAQVIDTVIHGIASVLRSAEGLGAMAPVISAWGMLLVQSFTNLLIPSGSGQAYVTMPIMAPLADLTRIGRETAILAYQFGDGFTNMIVPTNPLLMGMLALGRIPFQRWLRFILPLIGKIYVVLFLVLAYAATVKLQ